MNNNISKLHPEILDKDRQQLLQKLIPFTKGFVLAGGTALALQLCHRQSYDFDFFSHTPVAKDLIEKLSAVINIGTISVNSSDELTFFTSKEIKVTFLHYYFSDAFPVLRLENDLQMFTIKDIAIKKAYTIGRRGEYRDYFDLYTILKNKYITLEEMILKAKKIYGKPFEEKLFLQQLVYFGDIRNFDIMPIEGNFIPAVEEVKIYLEELVKKYLG